MKKRDFSCIHNYCDSCLHVIQEKNEKLKQCNYDCFTLNGCKGTSSVCQNCGQILNIENFENDFEKDIQLFNSALKNKSLKVICFTAPSVRVGLGDEFGFKLGENVQGKMISALKKLGADKVFDMNLAADFTITEEAFELKNRLETNTNLPMFTSCCPGWVSYCEKVCPEFKKNLSTCKSPQQMFGSIINNYYVEKQGLKSTDIFVVSIVPCYAKKLELKQTKLNTNVGYDVDLAITTKELANLIKENKIDFKELEEQEFDSFFGLCSGAGAIFGNTGGVLEAVLRSAGDHFDEENRKTLEYKMVRGLDGIRRAEIKMKNKVLKTAVVTGLQHVNIILEELKQDPKKYDFIEVMACDGGCIGGPGQPTNINKPREQALKSRAKGLYNIDKNLSQRKAHTNPAVQKVYQEFFGDVGGEKAKKYLHRQY